MPRRQPSQALEARPPGVRTGGIPRRIDNEPREATLSVNWSFSAGVSGAARDHDLCRGSRRTSQDLWQGHSQATPCFHLLSLQRHHHRRYESLARRLRLLFSTVSRQRGADLSRGMSWRDYAFSHRIQRLRDIVSFVCSGHAYDHAIKSSGCKGSVFGDLKTSFVQVQCSCTVCPRQAWSSRIITGLQHRNDGATDRLHPCCSVHSMNISWTFCDTYMA